MHTKNTSRRGSKIFVLFAVAISVVIFSALYVIAGGGGSGGGGFRGGQPIANNPKGWHDESDCSRSRGWACDGDDYSQALRIDFYADGPAGSGRGLGSVYANQERESAVGSECGGNRNHGFSYNTPDSLKDGQTHTIYAYGINIGGSGSNQLLSGSPKSITCCVSNAGQSCNCGACGCGGTVSCSGSCSGSNPTPSNYGQACGNCGTIGCSGSCINQGPCSPGQTQCSGTRYQTCNSGCQWQNSGTDADGDGIDAQCGDSQCDNSPGVSDSTKATNENSCTDGLDNDCDTKTDCNDNECDGSIAGSVKNQNNVPISLADVIAKQGLTTVKSAVTDQQGSYSFGISCGTYNLVASHGDYAPKTKSSVAVNPMQQTTVNFEGSDALVLGTSCEQDCTFAADNIVHAACDGKNGCVFYDSTAKSACDNAQPGWARDYDASNYVICPSGAPQPKIEIQASVSCASGTLVKVTRIVVYNGKPVKLVVAACS